MRIPFLITQTMVTSMHRTPSQWRTLNAERSNCHPRGADPTIRFKRTVGAQAVKSDGDSERCENPAAYQHRQVGPTHPAVLPGQNAGRNTSDKRHDDCREHDRLLACRCRRHVKIVRSMTMVFVGQITTRQIRAHSNGRIHCRIGGSFHQGISVFRHYQSGHLSDPLFQGMNPCRKLRRCLRKIQSAMRRTSKRVTVPQDPSPIQPAFAG